MAKKATGGSGGRRKPAPPQVQEGGEAAAPGPGHNLADLKKKALPAIRAVLKELDNLETVSGEIRSKIKDLHEKGANETGVSRKIFKLLVKTVRDSQKLEAKLEELEASERDDLVACKEALSDTPLGDYVHALLVDSDSAAD